MEASGVQSTDGTQTKSSEPDFHSVNSASAETIPQYISSDSYKKSADSHKKSHNSRKGSPGSPKKSSDSHKDSLGSRKKDSDSHKGGPGSRKKSRDTKNISPESRKKSSSSNVQFTSFESSDEWRSVNSVPPKIHSKNDNAPGILKGFSKLKLINLNFSSSGFTRSRSSSHQIGLVPTAKEKKEYLDNIQIYAPRFVLSTQLYLISGIICITNIYQGYSAALFTEIGQLADQHWEISEDGTGAIKLLWLVAFLSILCSGYVADTIGRKYTIVIGAVLSVIGGVGGSYAQTATSFMFHLCLSAMSFGFLFVTSLIYISECSAPGSRGLMISIHSASNNLGLAIAIIFKLLLDDLQDEIKFRFYLGSTSLINIVLLCFTNFLPRSPRFCAMRFDYKTARASLNILRSTKETAQREMNRMKYAFATNKPRFQRQIFKSMFYTPHVRKAIGTCTALVFGVVVCSRIVPNYGRQMISLPRKRYMQVELISQIVAAVGSGLSFLVIDRYGRRISFYIGFFGQFISLIVLSLTTYQLQKYSPPASPIFTEYRDECNQYSTCWDCINSKTRCSFCYNIVDGIVLGGSCVRKRDNIYDKRTQCSLNATNEEAQFSTEHCPTTQRTVPIFGFIMLILFYNFGVRANVLTWITEISPQWCRGQFTSLMLGTLLLNLFIDYSRFIDNLALLFIIIAGCNVLIIGFVFVFVPETRCRPLEYTDLLFMPKSTRRKMAASINDHIHAHL